MISFCSRMYYDRKTDRITTSKVVPYGSIPYCSIAIEQEKFFPRDGLNQENNRIEPLLPDAANDSVWQRQDTWNSSRNDC